MFGSELESGRSWKVGIHGDEVFDPRSEPVRVRTEVAILFCLGLWCFVAGFSMTAGFRRQDVEERSITFFDANATSAASPRSVQPLNQNSPGRADGSSYFTRTFSSNVVVVMVVLLVAVVVAAFINAVARYVLRRRRQQQSLEEQNGMDKGLEKSVIEARLPVVAYGADSLKSLFDPAGESECVVCLCEFVHGEKLRLLPECQHGFHVGCIDAWLVTHKTCPVCRCSVLPGGSKSGGSAGFGSSRFGSARIASVDIEIETSGLSGSDSAAASDQGASSSTGRSNRSFRSMLPIEAMASIISGGVGPHRLITLRNQGRV